MGDCSMLDPVTSFTNQICRSCTLIMAFCHLEFKVSHPTSYLSSRQTLPLHSSYHPTFNQPPSRHQESFQALDFWTLSSHWRPLGTEGVNLVFQKCPKNGMMNASYWQCWPFVTYPQIQISQLFQSLSSKNPKNSSIWKGKYWKRTS